MRRKLLSSHLELAGIRVKHDWLEWVTLTEFCQSLNVKKAKDDELEEWNDYLNS